MAARVIQGDVFDVLPTLKPGSVDCVVTSVPYWMLRSYLPKEHPLKARELGSEKTPGEYVANMVRVFDMVKTALADHGTCWLNIGDSYSHDSRGGETGGMHVNWHKNAAMSAGRTQKMDGPPAGNLCLIPQRLAIALQDAGWIVRSIVIWHKPAPMPASLSGWQWRRCRVKVAGAKQTRLKGKEALEFGASSGTANSDMAATWHDCPGCKKCTPHGGYILRRGSWRPTSSYEPVLMLAKSAGYFADGEPVKTAPVGRDKYTRVIDDPDEQFAVKHDHETFCDGANLRDVWTIASEPLKEEHYAAFPTALVEKCLRAGTSAKGYCPECGSPWARVIESVDTGKRQKMADGWDTDPGAHGNIHRDGREQGEPDQPVLASKTVDWRPSCDHADLEPRAGLVLDPFAGSGRTAIAANSLGLDSIGIELNPDYVTMARRLIHDDAPLFSGFEAA